MWVGEVPAWLPALTVTEEVLIARVRPRCYIFKLQAKSVQCGRTSHRAIRGHVISFPQNTLQVYKILPCSCGELVETIKVIFFHADRSREAIREKLNHCKVLKVRRQVVEALLVDMTLVSGCSFVALLFDALQSSVEGCCGR